MLDVSGYENKFGNEYIRMLSVSCTCYEVVVHNSFHVMPAQLGYYVEPAQSLCAFQSCKCKYNDVFVNSMS